MKHITKARSDPPNQIMLGMNAKQYPRMPAVAVTWKMLKNEVVSRMP
jgi:hypothetical protein